MGIDIDFSKRYEYEVDIYHDVLGALGFGSMSFGAGQFVHVSFHVQGVFKSPGDERVLKAKSKNGDIFTLFNCQYGDYFLYSDLIFAGDVGQGVRAIVVRYSDISEWFMRGQHIKGTVGESLVWVNPTQQLDVSMDLEGKCFSVKSETVSGITKRGEERLIHEFTRFVIERYDSVFELVDLKNKPLELSNLLSIVVAQPLTIVSMYVRSDGGNSMAAYFPTFKRQELEGESSDFLRGCLISKATLDSQWQAVFDQYYSSRFREVSWVRLAGMQRYEGFWEYKVLGYVSMLDRYVTTFSEINMPRSVPQRTKKAQQLIGKLESLKHSLGEEQQQELVSLIDSVFTLKREPDFSEKYHYAMSFIDPDILKVVNLSSSDFTLIKYVRDTIAHGDALDLERSPHNKIHIIVGKLTLLMTYIALMDFGLKPLEFAYDLERSSHSLKYTSDLDVVHLERITGAACFLPVSEEVFDSFSRYKGVLIDICFSQNIGGRVERSDQHTLAYSNWMKSIAGSSGRSTYEGIFGVDQSRVEHWGTAYIECGDRRREIINAFVIREG